MNTIEQLKAGKCLCTKCGMITTPSYIFYQVRRKDGVGFNRVPGYLVKDKANATLIAYCGNECTYSHSGERVAAITWPNILEGDAPDGISVSDYAWLEAEHPDVVEALEKANETGLAHALMVEENKRNMKGA